MKNYDDISIRSASSFREEARSALQGKWNAALIVTLMISLLMGSIIGAGCTYETSTEISPYWELEAYIGPFASISYWKNGELINDSYWQDVSYPFMLPYSPLFVAAAALTALIFVILYPIVSIAENRLAIAVLDGDRPDFSIFRISGRQYWLLVRTELLALWYSFWPMLVLMLIGGAVAMMASEARFLFVLFALAGVIIASVRSYRYVAAVYLTVTRPDVTAREAVQTSAHMMQGRKWRFICLALSFIGWALLYAIFEVALEEIIGADSVIFPVSLLSSLAFIPLSIYLTVSNIAFLRDAERRALNPAGESGQSETDETSAELSDALSDALSAELPAPNGEPDARTDELPKSASGAPNDP